MPGVVTRYVNAAVRGVCAGVGSICNTWTRGEVTEEGCSKPEWCKLCQCGVHGEAVAA